MHKVKLAALLAAWILCYGGNTLAQQQGVGGEIPGAEQGHISGQEQHPDLVRLRDKISGAGSLNEARTLALTPTAAAIYALNNARSIMPFSEDLRLAETRLADTRSRIETANTPRQVADEFSGMMLASLDGDKAASLKVGKHACNYSTGEVIAIVVGLILGIIPGLILLIVLC